MARNPRRSSACHLRHVLTVVALAGGTLIGPLLLPAGAADPITCTGEDQLQPALDDVVADGTVITIAEGATCNMGTYVLPSGFSITLEGAGAGATLDGDTGDGNVQILRGEDVHDTTIRNLTFVNGTSADDGGAIEIDGESSPVLESLRFFDNDAEFDGGAVSIQQSSEGADPVIVRDSTFGSGVGDNLALEDGGALYVNANNDVVVQGNEFVENDAEDDGGAARILTPGTVTATDNTFTDNEAVDNGGALDVNAQTTVLSGNTFTNNESVTEDGGGADVQGYEGAGTATITDNVFTDNYASESGGGLFIDVGLATVERNIFEDNRADSGTTSDSGGGLYADVDETDSLSLVDNDFIGNSTASDGGGAFIDLDSDATAELTGNTFTENEAAFRGGGAYITAFNDASAELVDNRFEANKVVLVGCQAGYGNGGGGLAIEGDTDFQTGAVAPDTDGHADVAQRGNTFVDNVVEPGGCAFIQGTEVYDGELHGGGEMVVGADVDSVDDTFIANRVTNQDSELTGDAEGAGLSFRGLFTDDTYSFVAHNLVLAANVLEGLGEGAGAYFGANALLEIEIGNATVVANRGISGGAGLGGGGVQDQLVVKNSIVHGNTASSPGEDNPDIAGFSSTRINFSDVCTTGITLDAASGDNICAAPMLVDAAAGDVHQTAASPTLDAASNALVPSALANDYEGEARIADANGDGPTPAVVDMGADEMQAPAPVPIVVTPAVQATNLTAPGSIGEDDGYCLSARDGGVFTFGGCQFFGAASGAGRNPNVGRIRLAAEDITAPQSLVKLNAPVISIAMVPADTGYWQAAEDGGVFSFGSARFYGSMGATPLTKPIVGIASSPTGNGYWLVASDGGVFSFGDAPFLGSAGGMTLAKPIVGITATPSGQGYWLVASDGGVFSFGDAQFFGSTGGQTLNAPIVGMASRPGGLGYWLAAADGGVFTFGDAPFLGNRVGQPLNAPVIGIKGAASGNGYWLVAKDGGIFSYGSAPFLGSTGSMKLNQPVIDMTG